MLIDAHVHVWNRDLLDYPWLAGIDALDRDFSPADIDRAAAPAERRTEGAADRATDDAAEGAADRAADGTADDPGDGPTDSTATTGMVFVQAGCRDDQGLAEARWVASLAAADAWPELRAIVAAADLRGGVGLIAHLDALARVEGARVVGVRHLLQEEPADALSGPAADVLVAGLRTVSERGLTFDLCVRHAQLGSAARLAERVPEARMVLDHVGKPPITEGIDSSAGRSWADALARLARLPNVHVKLSGLAAEAPSTAVLDAHAGAFLERAIRVFGADRCMIGSDWPVSAVTGAGGTFAGWRARVRAAATDAGVGREGIRDIEGGTAARFYGL